MALASWTVDSLNGASPVPGLVQSLALLHSTVLPTVDNVRVKSEICSLCEKWFGLRLEGSDEAGNRIVIYLLRQALAPRATVELALLEEKAPLN